MDEKYERDEMSAQAENWLENWAAQGWLNVSGPTVVGDWHGRTIVRFTLERTVAARTPPGVPVVLSDPPWHDGATPGRP